jgi:hypothetical protein
MMDIPHSHTVTTVYRHTIIRESDESTSVVHGEKYEAPGMRQRQKIQGEKVRGVKGKRFRAN